MRKWAWGLSLSLLSTTAVRADYKDVIGYTQLAARLGGATPTGAGVAVGQIEAQEAANAYRPDFTNPDFSGKNLTDVSGFGVNSSHATTVGQFFYGNSGIAPGITNIRLTDADDWYTHTALTPTNSWLRVNQTLPPDVETVKVTNHSYVGSFGSVALDTDALRRIDMQIDRDKVIAVVGVDNGGGLTTVACQAYNQIAVGRTVGGSGTGPTTIDVPGRSKPDIVAPGSFTSFATPMVAASAALLVQTAGANNNAKQPETIKALLMAGATKGGLPTWSHTTTRPLDARYGAGQLNINNSHLILTAGEKEASTSTTVSSTGWDFDTITPGAPRYFYFDVTASGSTTMSAILAWDRHIGFNAGILTPSLANIDLKLFQSDNAFALGALLDSSVSTIDNVEHLFETNLALGRYAFELTTDQAWNYAFAWQFTVVPEPTQLLAAALFVAIAFRFGLRKRKAMRLRQ